MPNTAPTHGAAGVLPAVIRYWLDHVPGANAAIVDGVRAVADRRGVTPAQVALAWVLAQGDHVVPIPGTKRRRWLEENAAAAELVLEPTDLADLAALPRSVAPRY